MSSVLLSLILSMFTFVQALTSLMLDCIERNSSDILSGAELLKSSFFEYCQVISFPQIICLINMKTFTVTSIL